MTHSGDRRRKWRANSIEDCLRAFLEGQSSEDYLFRRVDDDLSAELYVWEIPEPVRRGKAIMGAPGRLLGCYKCISSFRRTVQIDPDLGKLYGVQEVYLHAEDTVDHFSYLDRTGKVRPLNLVVDGSAVQDDADEAFLREQIVAAIPHALEPIYPYSHRG